jgi:hypothetical protein
MSVKLAGAPLKVSNSEISVTIPSELLQTIAANGNNGQILFSFEKVDAQGKASLLTKVKESYTAEVRSAGEVFDFKLYFEGQDQTFSKPGIFAVPVTITLTVAESADRNKAGIYYIGDDGELEYVGGEWSEDGRTMTAQVTHFSKYGVLEYDKKFVDVPERHWAAEAIASLSAKHIIQGFTDVEFAPGQPVTRAQFVAMLVRALRLEANHTVEFVDVSHDAWHFTAIAAAVQAGLVNGVGKNRFAPDDVLTREQMVVMLVRAYEWKTGQEIANNQMTFADHEQINDWAVESIVKAAGIGLIKGTGDYRFSPASMATRAESAQAIFNFLTR